MTINISLTQFLSFSTSVSTSAKKNQVNKIKYNSEYHPAIDYWKTLRDEIKRLHEKNLPIENLRNILPSIPEKQNKRSNYHRAVNTYIKFINSNNVEYFPVGKAMWQLRDELIINAGPELGLIINGQKYYVKNYYKKKNASNKVDVRNIQTTLAMMQLSRKDFVVDPNAKYAVLNFQNGKLIESGEKTLDSGLDLMLDAEFFVTIWNNI